MKRTRKKSSMPGRDSHGTTWLEGWGHDRRLMRRLERRRREHRAHRFEERA